MSSISLEVVLRRDRLVTAVALVVIVALAWVYVLWFAASMSMPAAPETGMAMDMVMGPAFASWTASDVVLTTAMWIAMMIGMMTPSAAPMILLYARVGQNAAAKGKPFASTAWFAGGYMLAWSGFAIVATGAQLLLEQAALLSPEMSATSRVLSGVLLIVAGLYQWTPLKNACLGQCRAPLSFIQEHGGFRRDAGGSVRLGLRHGLYCIGCCWALMALLFVGGVMNPLWIAGIAALVLLEKLLPTARWLPRVAGVALAAAGVWMLMVLK